MGLSSSFGLLLKFGKFLSNGIHDCQSSLSFFTVLLDYSSSSLIPFYMTMAFDTHTHTWTVFVTFLLLLLPCVVLSSYFSSSLPSSHVGWYPSLISLVVHYLIQFTGIVMIPGLLSQEEKVLPCIPFTAPEKT